MNTKIISIKEGYYMHTHIRQIAILTLLMCLFATSALAAQMSVEPVYQEVFQGDNVTVDIVVYPEGSEVYGANYALYFNNTLLNATSQVKGPFLTSDGASSTIFQDNINNSIGKIIYAESRSGTTVGITDPGVLTTITFQAIGDGGVSSLDLGELDGLLLCSISGSIPTTVNNGGVKINETPRFEISGFVEYDSGDQVLHPDVMITNLNTGGVFVAEANASSNHYYVSTDVTNISIDDVLHFDVSDDLGNATEFDHTVTHDEMDAGGFVQNITLYIPDTTPPVITNISIISKTKNSATIAWETDEASDSLVKYGTESGNYTETAYDATDVIYHSIDLVGLTSNTTYYYAVNSTDTSDNSAQSAESNFTTFAEILIEIGDVGALIGENVTASIMIGSAPNVGTADILLTYNQSVVHVISVNESDFGFMDSVINNSIGVTRIGAFQISSGGLSGDVKLANVTLMAVGTPGSSSMVCITINELKEATSEEISIPASTHNGTFTIGETTPPLVTSPEATPSCIPEDTDFDPGWGETSQLNITVADACGVASVTINLSSIGGLPDQPMIHIPGTDVWTVTVNASVGTAILTAPDTTPPVISNVTESGITNSSATIAWDTDELADSLVRYGTASGNYTLSANDLSLVLGHSIGLIDLIENTTYYYVVNSTDLSGNSAQSAEYNFTTLETPDTTPPVISNVTESGITNSSATIAWDTDELADSLVRYGTASGNYTLSANDLSLVLGHSIGLIDLIENTTYYYVVNSTDLSGNSAQSAEYNFTTST